MKRLAMLAAGSLVGLLPNIASAHPNFFFGINFPIPFFAFHPAYCAPVYAAPAPVYVSPPPVYVAPPVTYAPAPTYYYAPPAVYSPAPVYVSGSYCAPSTFYYGYNYAPRYYGGFYGGGYYRGGGYRGGEYRGGYRR